MISNAINKETLRKVQLETLETLKDILSKSFGPYGSNTIIDNGANSLPRYTKDGHTILKNVKFGGAIERTVCSDIEAETRTQATKVGDSTTSVTILSYYIFKALAEYEEQHPEIPPADIISNFKDVIEEVKEKIKSYGRSATIKDMYDIAFISTNGNDDLARELAVIYENYGLDVYVDVKASMNGTTYVKEIDGMVIESGVIDNTFCNNPVTNECQLSNPKIYAFKDPIDTMEMGAYLDLILHNNIINPMFKEKDFNKVVPTVILAPKISRDFSAFMDEIVQYNSKAKSTQKLPLNIVTNIVDMDGYSDICDLCGCKYIKKYIDPEIFKMDIEHGLAATPDNVDIMAGSADMVSSDNSKTIFINPQLMLNDKAEYSDKFNQLLNYLQGEIDKLTVEGTNLTEVYKLKKRLNSLKGNMVEIFIGGVTVADRDQQRDLMEDATLNCRSAAKNGVGYGANFEGFRASRELISKLSKFDISNDMIKIIYNSYEAIVKLLYNSKYSNSDIVDNVLKESLEKGYPINLRTGEYDNHVLSSIDSDICALDSISKIVTIMATSNQMLLPNVNDYKY